MSYEKELKWNLKSNEKNFSSSHSDYLKTNQDEQQQQQLSSSYSSTSNVQDFSTKVQQ